MPSLPPTGYVGHVDERVDDNRQHAVNRDESGVRGGRSSEYDPLDYVNLARSCVLELLRQPVLELPLRRSFRGAGVYALFYAGDFPPYAPFGSMDQEEFMRPIYVGKAEPSGSRMGAASGEATRGNELYRRIQQHIRSIGAVGNLQIDDFRCRYLVVVPLWIRMVERFLVEDRRPPWNGCLDGFGLHDPGRGRSPVVSWWDAMHPGRPRALGWKANVQFSRDQQAAERRLREWLALPQERRPVAIDLDSNRDA